MRIDHKLAEELVALLKKKKLKLSSAESMTGGLFAKTITDVSGASTVFDRGLVTYSNEAKIELLDVDKQTIDIYGAISAQTAREMAEGLAVNSKSDVCISVTGNAGPNPSEKKEVGLYYLGLRFKDNTNVIVVNSSCEDRESIRNEACNNMMKMIYDCIK